MFFTLFMFLVTYQALTGDVRGVGVVTYACPIGETYIFLKQPTVKEVLTPLIVDVETEETGSA
jgi:hypothetical protein